MEAALKKLMEDSFGEYVSGGLGRVDSGFPLTLRDLKLNEKKIQEDMEEDGGGMPFELTSGKIGSISVKPGWTGVEIVASNIVLNLSFSAVKAMAWMMKREDADEAEDTPMREEAFVPHPAPPAPVAPRYCAAHATSEQRVKTEPRFEECQQCHLRLQTNYADFAYCPPCSEKLERCMLCGSHAPSAGSYVPAQHLQHPAGLAGGCPAGPAAEPRGACSLAHEGAVLPPPPPPARIAPRFCAVHDSSEKRSKGEPQQMECTDCHTRMQTNYTEFSLCPTCSSRQERCMICGAGAPSSGSRAPAPRSVEARSASELPARAAPELPAGGDAAARGNHRGGHSREVPDRDAVKPALGRPAVTCPPDDKELGPAAPTTSRPLPRGGWRDASRPAEKREAALQMGCGLPCALGGPGGDGIMGFFRIFEFGSWSLSQCNSQCSGGGLAALHRDFPEDYSPKVHPSRGGA